MWGSAAAYACFVFAYSFLVRLVLFEPHAGKNISLREGAACAALTAGFFFIPPGSLPPFCNAPWGGAAFACLFIFSMLADRDRCFVLPAAALLLACGASAWFYWRLGVPGSVANFGSYTASPVWSVGAFWGEAAGAAFLALGMALAAGQFAPPPKGGTSLAAVMRYMAACAVVVVFVFPWNLAPYVSWPAGFVAGCDFILFWGKILLACACLRRLRLVPRAGALSLAFAAVGAAIIIASIV